MLYKDGGLFCYITTNLKSHSIIRSNERKYIDES